MDLDKLIEEWFRDNFLHPIISERVEAYNLCFAAKEDLKKRLGPARAAEEIMSEKEEY